MSSNPEDGGGSQELLQADLMEVEKMVNKQLEKLETAILTHFHSEDPAEGSSLLETASPESKSSGILSVVKRHIRAEEALLKEMDDLREQLKDQQIFLQQTIMERDILQQQNQMYLETNSSLRARLEEQRCQRETLQGKLNADLISRINLLESENEKLSNLNLKKDNELCKVNLLLEQTAKCLRNREAEAMIRKNEENNLISVLKSDLRKVLEEKAHLEEKYASLESRVDDYIMNKNMEGLFRKKNSLRRSLSGGDINWKNLVLEKNAALETSESSHQDIRSRFQNAPKAEPHPKPLTVPRFLSEDTSSVPKTSPVHAQLKALKGDLLNVTRKLESLKCQLVNSGVVEEDPKETETRRLKRKAEPIEDHDGVVAEEQKSEFKNLKNILQDARNLNAKLQNLREEKQRIFDLNKKEVAVQVTEKRESRNFHKAVTKLKKAVSECEEKLEGGVVTEAEAFAGLVSPFYACILSNSRCFYECRKRTGSEVNDETDTDSLMDDRSTEVSSTGEDGGGDNLLKKQNSNRGLDSRELKSQMDHFKCKIEHVEM